MIIGTEPPLEARKKPFLRESAIRCDTEKAHKRRCAMPGGRKVRGNVRHLKTESQENKPNGGLLSFKHRGKKKKRKV